MEYDPVSVALKFGFLAVLYLFVLVIARSAFKDLRRTLAPAPDSTGFHAAPAYAERRFRPLARRRLRIARPARVAIRARKPWRRFRRRTFG